MVRFEQGHFIYSSDEEPLPRPPQTKVCPLCGTTLWLGAANRPGERWKAVVQELKFPSPRTRDVRQRLVQPAYCSPAHRRPEVRAVHSACWKTVSRMWKKSSYTVAELDVFWHIACSLAPFLPDIPFKQSPARLESTIDRPLGPSDLDALPSDTQDHRLIYWEHYAGSLGQEKLTSPSLVGIKDHELPTQLETFIAHVLRDAAEVRRSADPNVRFWISVITMLANSPATQFSKKQPDRESRIAQAIRNLQLGGISQFPHTANFDVVRSNIITILVILVTIPLEDPDAADTDVGKRASFKRSRNIMFKSIPSPMSLCLTFYTVRRRSGVQCIRDREVLVGLRYLRFIEFDASQAAETDVVVPITQLSGFRLVRDAVGVISVQVRDGEDWMGMWQQDTSIALTRDKAIEMTEAEWTPGVDDGHLILTADAVKDQIIGLHIKPPQSLENSSQASSTSPPQ